MFSLTYQERKILIIIGAFLLLGALVRVSRTNFFKEEKEEIKADFEKKININQAALEELIAIPSIGEKTAQRILEYRKNQGRIKELNELLNVKGIGQKKLNIIKEYIAF